MQKKGLALRLRKKRCRDTNAALLAVKRMLPTAVSNPLHDPKSQNEHQQLPQLRLDFQAQRLKISPVLAINPAVLERNSIEANLKLVARVAAAKKGHKKALARNNEDNRKVKEATIAKAVQAAGGKVTKAVGGPTNAVGGLTEMDIRKGIQLFGRDPRLSHVQQGLGTSSEGRASPAASTRSRAEGGAQRGVT